MSYIYQIMHRWARKYVSCYLAIFLGFFLSKVRLRRKLSEKVKICLLKVRQRQVKLPVGVRKLSFKYVASPCQGNLASFSTINLVDTMQLC